MIRLVALGADNYLLEYLVDICFLKAKSLFKKIYYLLIIKERLEQIIILVLD